MRPYIIIFTFLISYKTYSQKFEIINGDTVNRVDRKGLKQGKWIEFYGDNGRSETYFVNGKEEGEYRWYDKKNNISEHGFSKNGKAEGKTSEFQNGKLWRTRIYHNDKIASQIIEYYENGQPKNGGNYFWGNGVLLEYDSLGFITSKKTYREFKLNGQFEEYFTNRQLKEKGIYKNNKYWTIYERYDSLGNKLDFGTIKSGNGHLYCYNDSGRMIKSEEYKLGRLWNIFRYIIRPNEYENVGSFRNGNGVLKEFNSSGKLVSELTYKNGLLNGLCKYYYGDSFEMGECINDNREGKWFRYYRGRIQNIFDYKADRATGITCF